MSDSEGVLRRAFLGIPVSREIQEKAALIQKELFQIEGGWKQVKPENLHFTIKFLGEISEEKLEKATEKIASADLGKRFFVKVKKLGLFPNENYITVVWLGLEDEEQIFYLHKQIDFALSKLFPLEKDFLAHLTLARVKYIKDREGLRKFLDRYQETILGEMEVNKVVLYESRLEKSGPIYSIIKEFELK